MKPLPASEFAAAVKGMVRALPPDAAICGFALDSREVKPGDLFIAIKGDRSDGHDFAAAAAAAGAVATLVSRPLDGPCIVVPDVVEALAAFASSRRATFDGPVVAVTGSAGKTTTKELIAAALSPLGPVLKTEGNRNSEFTAPLVWAGLEPSHRSVVVEMGMRGYGQISHLAAFTKPTIGLVTNIGCAHIELVGSREGIAKAKSELLEALPSSGHAVLWAEDPYLGSLTGSTKASVHTFGFSAASECRITAYVPKSWRSCEISGTLGASAFQAELPFVGRHLALNAAAAILTADLSGVEIQRAAGALVRTQLPPLRMEVIDYGGVTLVLDAYNASPPSTIAALETLRELPAAGRRVAVLGDMRELGPYAEQGHREVGAALAHHEIDETLLFGECVRWTGSAAQSSGFPASRIRYADSIADIAAFLQSLKPGDVALVKGSRALEMERALDFIQETVA